MFATFIVLMVMYDLLHITPTTDRTFLAKNDQKTLDFNAFELAKREAKRSQDLMPVRALENELWKTFIVYEAKTPEINLFTEKNVNEIIEFEQKVQESTQMWDMLCLAEGIYDTSCSSEAMISMKYIFD